MTLIILCSVVCLSVLQLIGLNDSTWFVESNIRTACVRLFDVWNATFTLPLIGISFRPIIIGAVVIGLFCYLA